MAGRVGGAGAVGWAGWWGMQDDPSYDEKVDIYSAGLILWYIALGERPFDRVPAEVPSYPHTLSVPLS